MKYLIEYKKYILFSIALIILAFFSYLYVNEVNANNESAIVNNDITCHTSSDNSFYVDVKGAVNKPGVYEFKDGDKVIDAINTAGGLTKSGVTNNINLSQKLKSEMVIYIFSKSELNKQSTKTQTSTTCKCETIEVNNCITTTKTITSDNIDNKTVNINSKININTASLEELTSLSGIGESKAEAILKYRNEHGNFLTIEDIKNVSGLGDNLFDKIKDNITV